MVVITESSVWLERHSWGFSVAHDYAGEVSLPRAVIQESQFLSTAYEEFKCEDRIPLLLHASLLQAWHRFLTRGDVPSAESSVPTLLKVASVRYIGSAYST